MPRHRSDALKRARAAVAVGSGAGVGILGALALLYASHSAALATVLAASAGSVAVLSFVVFLWLDTGQPAGDARGPALVVFLLSIALGLMLAAGAHGGHG
ncbi:MAG: hypothetical protein M3310_07275 [Actinomycetota bacterium]|nr:hypothetical protein [Actinomycetota bacterium]